jgi:hypothetical protein
MTVKELIALRSKLPPDWTWRWTLNGNIEAHDDDWTQWVVIKREGDLRPFRSRKARQQ